jgi:hypothetical protein
MNLQELRDLYRLRSGDRIVPYFCSDDEVDAWANEAEAEACRRAHLLVDSSSEVTYVDVPANGQVLAIDERIIGIRRARLVTANRRLAPIVVRDMDDRYPNWESATASAPLVFIPDYESGAICLYPPAATADVVRLTVVRTPLEAMACDEDSPEIPSRYHPSLVHYILSEAYNKQDADLFDPKKAEQHALMFAAEFGAKSSAINERWALEQYYGIGET